MPPLRYPKSHIILLNVSLLTFVPYKLETSLNEKGVVDGHDCHTALHFGVKAKENQDTVPTMYWLPKLHKKTL